MRLPLEVIVGSRKCPAIVILKAYDLARDLRDRVAPIISSFHTPAEKDMLEVLLKGKGLIVVVYPVRGLEEMRIPSK